MIISIGARVGVDVNVTRAFADKVIVEQPVEILDMLGVGDREVKIVKAIKSDIKEEIPSSWERNALFPVLINNSQRVFILNGHCQTGWNGFVAFVEVVGIVLQTGIHDNKSIGFVAPVSKYYRMSNFKASLWF